MALSGVALTMGDAPIVMGGVSVVMGGVPITLGGGRRVRGKNVSAEG
jgi:hypothetical protein